MKLVKLVSILLLSVCSYTAVSESENAVTAPHHKSYKASGLDNHIIIDPHLEAYNRKDFEGFKVLFHEEIEVYDFPNKLLFKGLDNLDKNYEMLVTKIDKFAFVSKRIIEGGFVVDLEIVKAQIPGEGEKVIEGLVIYQMKDNLIYRMMFLKDN